MSKITIKNVENYLLNIQNRGHLEGLSIVYSDARLGKLIALGEVSDMGSIYLVATDYLTPTEMWYFLQGYDKAKNNQL